MTFECLACPVPGVVVQAALHAGANATYRHSDKRNGVLTYDTLITSVPAVPCRAVLCHALPVLCRSCCGCW